MTKKASLFPLYLVNFIGTFGFSIVLPFLVFLVEDFGGNAIMYGLLGATYSTFQLFGAPILGKMSDTYGRRKILLLSQAGTALSWIIFIIALFLPVTTLLQIENGILGSFALTVPLIIIFLARAFDGLTGGNISVANALLADMSTKTSMKKNYGTMSVYGNIGFIGGPMIAGLLGATALGYKLPVMLALVISLVAIFIIYKFLVDVKKKDEDVHKENWKVIFKIRFVPFLLILYFIIFLGYNIYYTAFPVHAIQALEWSVFDMGIYFSILSGMMAFIQGPVLSKLSDKCSDSILVIVGMIILASAFVVMLSPLKVVLYGAALLFAIGTGLMWPSFLSILSKAAGEKHQGYVQGLASSAGSLASIIGLISGGFLYNIFSARTFLVTAVILFGAFLLTLRMRSIEDKCALH